MAINQNHLFDDLEGIKCAIAEKNCTASRAAFLKELLTHNGYTVVIAQSAPAKGAAPAGADGAEISAAPATYTLGVTDLSFNPTNAIFGRLLRTIDGHVVTPAFWKQKDQVAHDELPYFDMVK